MGAEWTWEFGLIAEVNYCVGIERGAIEKVCVFLAFSIIAVIVARLT